MSSNVQTQINDLNAAVQALDSSLTQITGNTMSNYNQLSRIVSQQANIYNTLYYGTGNMSTGNLSVSANALISGNLVINGNIVSSGNLNVTGNTILNGGTDILPRFDSDWFAVEPYTRYTFTLPFTIDLSRPPQFQVLFSTTATGIISDGAANVVCDITSQGIDSTFNESYAIRYISSSIFKVATGDSNIAFAFNAGTKLTFTSGYYRVYAR